MSAHHHDHSHDHYHDASNGGSKRLVVALVVTLFFAAIEAIAGWWAGSLALMGDAGHMVSDSTALGIAAFAAFLASKPPTARLTYGLGRAEIIAALVNAGLMLALVTAIILTAIGRFGAPRSIDGPIVIIVALIGLVINIVLLFILSRGSQTLNTRGAVLHVMGDFLGSVAALVSGIVIYFTNWTPIDAILSIFICILIAVSAMRLLRESLHVIMEGVPSHLSSVDVGTAMAESDGVRSVHDLHIWTVSSGQVALSAHVVIDEFSRWPEILSRINHMLLDRFHINHSTLQPETNTHILHRHSSTDAAR